MRIALTGASGFVGKALQKTFSDFTVIDRDDDIPTLLEKLNNIDVVINLAGAPILKRWSENYKKILIHSRVAYTRKLVKAINLSKVPYFISTSAIGIYPNNKRCDESCTQQSEGFLAELTQAWEAEALKCIKPTAILRLGLVLGKEGGALHQMLLPFRLGIGGRIGDGTMIMSWIHIKELIGIYEFLMAHQLSGIFNATSPNPISNRIFTKQLGKYLHRPTFLSVPKFVLKLFYAQAATLLSDSKEVYPKHLEEAGYMFRYPMIDGALADIFMHSEYEREV